MSASPAAAVVGPAVCKGPAVLGGMPAVRQLPSLLFIVLLVHSSVTVHRVSGAERCQFPEEWRGRWYQGGLGEVVIKDTAISKKGVCRTRDDTGFYVLEDRDENCKRCMYMMKQHRNVIQYKEEPSTPVRCPFQGAYFFSYNNNTGGECKEPMSYIQPCASAAKYSFHFKSCPAVPHAFEREMKFECLATWRVGSDTFIYGGFSGYGVSSRDDSYRCFKFKALGRQMFMSMSADPSCLGLDGPKIGPLTMELTTDTINWPTAGCKFAEFFEDVNWIDLSGKHYYLLNSKKSTITVDYKRTPTTKANTKYAFRCVAIRKHNQTINEYTYITHSSHGCDPERRCLKLRLKRPNVMEITLGRVLYDEGEDCDDSKFTDAIVHLALPETARAQTCPGDGKYTLDKSTGCEGYLNIGCNSSHTMNLQASCHPQKGLTLECLSHWQEKGRVFIIARGHHKDSHATISNCFNLAKVDNKLQLLTAESCNLEVSNLLGRRPETYILKTPAVPCSREDSYTVHKQKPRQKEERKKEEKRKEKKQTKVQNKNTHHNNNNNVNKNSVEPEGPLESSTGGATSNSLHSIIAHVLLCVCLSRTLRPSGGWIL